MGRNQNRKLSQKTQDTLQKVKERSKHQESIVESLRRTHELAESATSADSLREQIDVEKARLKDVIGEKVRLQGTIGQLIAGYDALTNSLGGQIDSMKDMTTWESLVGFFSASSARQMREERIQQADIDDQLQDLVVQTQAINRLLSDHLTVLNEEYTAVKEMLSEQLELQRAEAAVFEECDVKLEELNFSISEKREALAELTGVERVQADEQLQILVNEANEVTERRNAALSNAQTHELFAENHKIALDSLVRQKAAQRILIDKLRISTENRIVQYSATLESLRTAAQQESAHAIDEIGTDIDHETTRTMAAIGSAADRQIVDMLERHSTDIQKRRATQSEIARADAEFAKRFAEVAQKFLEDAYDGE